MMMMKMMGFDPMGSMPVGLNIEFKLHCLRKDFLMIFIFEVCTWSWWRQEGGRRFEIMRCKTVLVGLHTFVFIFLKIMLSKSN